MQHTRHLLTKAQQRHADGNLVAAIHLYKRVLKKTPNDPAVLNNLGAALIDIFDYDLAIEAFTRAHEINPDTLGLRNNFANAHLASGNLSAAAQLFQTALEQTPTDPVLLKNLGNTLYQSNDYTGAIKCFEDVINQTKNDAAAHCLRGFSHAALGLLGQCWDEYEWRWDMPNAPSQRDFKAPVWDGTNLGSKKLIIWGEQGIGDEIMFAGLLNELVKKGGHVSVECDPRLSPLFTRSFKKFQILSTSEHNLKIKFDAQLPIASLARYFRKNLKDFRPHSGYLIADHQLSKTLKQRYRQQTGASRLIGLSWQGGSDANRQQRSAALESWAPLLKNMRKGTGFISLQYGNVKAEIDQFNRNNDQQILHDSEINPLTNIDAATAQTAAMDMVITVPNTTAHLAGALNVKTWVLHPHRADWIWLLQGNSSPWYPSLKNMRQQRHGDWEEIIDTLTREFPNL